MLVDELFESADISEEIRDHRRTERMRLGDLTVDIDEHLDEREAQRGIDHNDVLEVLSKIHHARFKIFQLSRGEQFWLYDPGLDTAIGMRLLNDATKRIILKTALPRKPESPNPIFEV